MLFDHGTMGTVQLGNRVVRSATAEGLADDRGVPLPELATRYDALVRGGVGLIISGHMGVHQSGKAHARMTMADSDDLIPPLTALADAVHAQGGKIAAQINHAGRQVGQGVVDDPLGPSDHSPPPPRRRARAMTEEQIEQLIDAYADAARRVQAASFDAVQIHAAHGYLISQFLSPLANRRTDRWGGPLNRRARFLERVVKAVRTQVGPEFPVLIKLGIRDASEDGLTLDEGVDLVRALPDWGLDAVEISGGLSEGGSFARSAPEGAGPAEAYFRSWAKAAQAVTDLPIILVGGLRSRAVMEDILVSGDAQFVAMCRPLICEPDLPRRLQADLQPAASCVSQNRCWPTAEQIGISCKCPGVIRPTWPKSH